jgi:universal stress protein A
VDVNYSDLYTGLIDVNLGDMQKRISEETHHALSELSTNAGYPITETLSGSGDLGQVLVDAIKNTIWIWWFAVTIRISGAS